MAWRTFTFFVFCFLFTSHTRTHRQHEGRWLYIAHTIHRQQSCGRDVFRTPAWRFLREAHGRALGSILLYSPLLSLSPFGIFCFIFIFFSSSSSPVGSFVSVVRRRKPPAFSSTKAAWSCCAVLYSSKPETKQRGTPFFIQQLLERCAAVPCPPTF
jgi:hypothetical protein